MPRVTPSVVLIATARTWFWPMCCCTSAVSFTGYRAARILDLYGIVDLRQVLGLELYVENRADDLYDAANVVLRRRCLANSLSCDCSRHVSLYSVSGPSYP